MRKYIKTIIGILALSAMIGFWPSDSPRAATRTMSWGAVTTYIDGSLVEASNTVLYSAWYQDSVTSAITQIANKIPGTTVTFDDSVMVKGRAYSFWVQAIITGGASSDNSVKYAWTLPLVKLSPPGVITIQ
jgi:hypothetical protein